MTMMANRNVTTSAEPSWLYWRASDCQSWLKPGGSRRACSVRNCIASPMVTPGMGMAWNVAEFSWSNWVSRLGSTPIEIFTSVASGTCAPLALLT
ncbi:Uncharacterised protein [Bordetella pertussis]|nr:Uncharacterised protein [Bordetella pertussis]CFM09674.1 Uncharacterised protein [Bordetella pertussis]CFM39570.1 Uncharacterised protein [Bordetella pertussis]CFM54198.1 Uncharacterised protein [Bordetella pertussis]CFM74331.1 Uncharacterised protein [Bordetella pertussis]